MKLDSIKLRKFREKNRLSQAEFAESIGLSQATVCEWERKDTEIKLEYYTKLIEVHSESINDLIKEGTMPNISPNFKANSNVNKEDGIEVKIDAFQLQKDYMETLKATNEFYQKSFTSLLDKMADIISKIK